MEDPNKRLFENVYAQKIQMLSYYRRPNVLEHKHRLYFTIVGEGLTPSTHNPPERKGD
jgi:hypothetical protein